MAKPLFINEEMEAQRIKLENHEKTREDKKWDIYWAEKESIEKAFEVETIKRAQARAEEFLNTLIVKVGGRGSTYFSIDQSFSYSDSDQMKKLLTEADTPETRRALHTILKALTAVPRTWGMSAIVRFLRGVGKQEGKKYYGAGTFGVRYGWKEIEVKAICEILASDRSMYSKVLMSYADTEKEAAEAERLDPEYDRYDNPDPRFITRVERDVEFLNKLCGMLEARGLAPMPEPEPEKEKVPRKAKVFKPGDTITKGNLRDLPLPAYVEIPIERQNVGAKRHDEGWYASTMEQVVTRLYNNGRYECYHVGADKDVAFAAEFSWGHGKEYLYGAKYLGPWRGKLNNRVPKEPRFNFRRPGTKY